MKTKTAVGEGSTGSVASRTDTKVTLEMVAQAAGVSRRVDGIIALTPRLPDAALTACAQQFPMVVTGRNLKAQGRTR